MDFMAFRRIPTFLLRNYGISVLLSIEVQSVTNHASELRLCPIVNT